MKPAIEVVNLEKKKGKKRILHNINFNIHQGEVVGFLGANGAGKTTTLKCIMGLYDYEGTIEVLGQDIKKEHEEVCKKINGLIEEPCFYPYLSGMQNLTIHAMYYDKIKKKKIKEVISLLKMEEFIRDKVKSYSLGMKQRLGIALALINEPDIILLDEPMNGLDPDGIRELRELLKKMAHQDNKAIFVSSHILSEMQMLCDRVIFIQKGKIVGNESVGENLEEQYMTIMGENKDDKFD